ncbi:hypothetical protein [Methylorubrum zatmanii]
MIPVAPPIGVADVPGGYLVSLPPRLALVVSLRNSFRKVRAAAEAWTYFVPGPANRLGEWLAEVELQALTERRRRAWCSSDDEWNSAAAPAPAPAAAVSIPFIVSLPKTRTARPVLALLQDLAGGEVLLLEAGRFLLYPSGRPIAAGVARRAIEQRLVVPSCDGLFGPDWSQSWRAPNLEEMDAAAERSSPGGAAEGGAGKVRGGRSLQGARERRPRGAARTRPEGPPVADGCRRAAAGRRQGVGR